MAEERLIDATPILQDFLKIADRLEGKNPYENVKIKAYRRCFERVADAPTVNAELVRHGHWIEDGDFQICSECGEEHCWQDYRASYCEDCGAKMDEEGRSE